MTNADPGIIEAALKGLLSLHYGREAALTLRSLLPHLKNNELNQFSKSLVYSSCIKYLRQEGDAYLRKLAVCVLT